MSSEYADAEKTDGRTHKLELDGVTKRYGDLVAVDDMDLVLDEGEFICVLGPSGSGKTTTLNMIAGLERPTEGDVRIDGQRVNEDRPQDRDIGLVFQNLALFTSMTVAENIGFSKRVAGGSKSEIEATVDEFAEIVGLEGMQNRGVSSLSMSDQQRVALARALAAKPSLLLLDEPMDNLDAEEAIDMRGELKRLQSDLNQTMVYVTHDQEEAMSLADRIVVMHQGELMQVGTPRELYERPKNRFVAGFIGSPSMNFVDLAIETDGSVSLLGTSIDSTVLFDGLTGPDAIGDLGDIDTLTIAVRPESFEIDPKNADVPFQASLRDFEPHGSRTVLFVEAGGAEITLITEKRIDVEQGDRIPVGFDIEAAYLVDPDSDEVKYE
jgi:multiple sugar transport system ATP-binding protein